MTAENLALSPELLEAVRRISGTEHLLVALDFDGTLSPIVDRAEDARPLPRSAAALAELAELPRTTTALISGRALDSLRLVASPPAKTLLIGSHGAEAWLGPGYKIYADLNAVSRGNTQPIHRDYRTFPSLTD